MKRRLVIFISVLLLSSATYILGWSTLFTVTSVEIIGTRIQLAPGVSKGEKLARIEPRSIAAKFENLDWIADAKVSRNWINGKVTIEIIERVPVAIFNSTVIDSNGNSFALRGTPSPGLVQIQAKDLAAAKRAVNFFTTLPSEIKSALTVVKIRNAGALILKINKEGRNLEIRWGSDEENELKLKVYQEVIALPENATIKRIDVSAPHAPIVK